MPSANGVVTGDPAASVAEPCPTCGEDLGALKRAYERLKAERLEARPPPPDPFHGMSQADLLHQQRRAIKFLKRERRKLREAMGRTGAIEDLYRISEICRQGMHRESRNRMEKLVDRLSR